MGTARKQFEQTKKKNPFSFINFCFPFFFRIPGNYDSSVRTSGIGNRNIPPLFLRNILSSVPQPQDLSCGLIQWNPSTFPSHQGQGHRRSESFLGSAPCMALSSFWVKPRSSIVNNVLCALPPSPSFLCPSVLVSYFLLPSRARASIPVSSGPR